MKIDMDFCSVSDYYFWILVIYEYIYLINCIFKNWYASVRLVLNFTF